MCSTKRKHEARVAGSNTRKIRPDRKDRILTRTLQTQHQQNTHRIKTNTKLEKRKMNRILTTQKMFDKCNINMYNQKYVYYSVYPNIGSVCPVKLRRGSIDRSLFTDTQLGSDDFSLCLLTDLKQNIINDC